MMICSIGKTGLALAVGSGLVLGLLGWSTSAGQTQAPAKGQSKSGANPDINAPFRKPNVKNFIAKFESEDREIYAKRLEIVKALDLNEGEGVADVGAGTGLFTRLFAEKVGPKGKVYAVDVAAPFLKHIADDAKKSGQTQVVTVLGAQDSIKVPPGSVDLVFLSDVYHHIEKPREVLASIHAALRPGGRLVVIDFDRVEGKSSSFVLKHIRASQKVFRGEIEEAGFAHEPTPNAPKLRENFFLKFRRVDRSKP